jgi:hypothetical protein
MEPSLFSHHYPPTSETMLTIEDLHEAKSNSATKTSGRSNEQAYVASGHVCNAHCTFGSKIKISGR